MSGIRVTVTDLDDADDTESVEIENDYLLICDGDHYLAHTNAHANGTHVLTIKRRTSEDES